MKEEKRLFPAQEKSELVLDILRKHWFSYMIFWFLVTLMLTPLLVGAFFWFGNFLVIDPVWSNVIIIFVPVYLLSILALLMYGFVNFYLDVYIITDRRIVDISQNGFFKRAISELNLRQIQDVNATVNGFAATLLHFGDVNIQTAGETPNFVFISIPHPYETSKKILDLHEAYLRQIEKRGRGGQKDKILQAEIVKLAEKVKEGEELGSPEESIDKTLTTKWFDDGLESCYKDDTCRQKILAVVDKNIAENKLVVEKKPDSKNGKLNFTVEQASKTEQVDKEGELKDGKKVDL